MKENIDTLQNKLEIKQNTINNLNKSRNEIIEEKNKMEEKYKSEINSLNNDVIKYKNIILNKNKIIQIYIENEQYIHLQFEEIEKLISSNNIKLNNLKEIYCTDLSLINKYYINVILTYKKKVINVLDKNDIDIAEIKQQLKSSNESFDYLNKIYNSFSNIYFDKCCTLLNEINKKEINIKYLSDKNNMQQISENNLNQKISSLEQENSLLKQEIKNAKQTNEIKLEENTKLKKDIEDLENQIKNLNNEILSYLDQIKQKEKIFEELNSNQKKNKYEFKRFRKSK
jgi:chromosome segregation ATPase